MEVVVIGGGAIGLACAFILTRAGARVTVLERDRCGGATSSGNAGWVTPMLSTPLPGPGVMRQALRWMLDPKSPFFVRPRRDPALLAWSWRFARNCTSARFEQGARALLALNGQTLRLFDELRDAGVDLELHEQGVIVVALSEDVLDKEWRSLRRLRPPTPSSHSCSRIILFPSSSPSERTARTDVRVRPAESEMG